MCTNLTGLTEWGLGRKTRMHIQCLRQAKSLFDNVSESKCRTIFGHVGRHNLDLAHKTTEFQPAIA